MNTKLIEKIKRSAIKGRLGDFICNFIAVVLGIAITFVGSDMIQEHNKKKEVAQALQLVKSELLINRETIEEMMKIEKINKEGACYLLQYKDKMNEASSDSLNYYGYFPFQSQDFLPVTDAMEMLRASSVMQNIKNKELAVEIIQAYAVIKNAHLFYEGFSKAKETAVEKCVSQQEFRKISNENKSLREILEFTILLPEGFAAMRQISFVHDDPHLTYSHYMKKPDLLSETGLLLYMKFNYASSATTSKGISTETSLCSLTIALYWPTSFTASFTTMILRSIS